MKIETDYVKPNQNVDKGTTSQRTQGAERISAQSAYKLDIAGTVMDNSAYKGQGKTTEDIMSEASQTNVANMRDYMTVMSNSMSEEDFAALKEDGFPIGSIKVEEVVTVVDKIKAELLKSGVNITGYTDDLSADAIKQIAGSNALAGLISQKLKEHDLPDTKENYEQIKEALDKAMSILEINEGTTKYMVENSVEPTVENIYKSQFSASEDLSRQAKGYFSEGMQGYYGKKADSFDFDKLAPQMERVIEEAGKEVNKESMESAKWLIEKGIPLTKENFLFLEDLKQIAFPKSIEELVDKMTKAIANGESANDANLLNQTYFLKEALHLKEEVESITPQALEKVASESKQITLETLLLTQKKLSKNQSNQGKEKKSENEVEVTAKRQLEEIRLKMTVEANLRLMKKGISIRTEELSELVEMLKKEEANFPSKLWEETLDKTAQIKAMPVGVIKELAIFPRNITLNEIHEKGNMLKKAYIEAEKHYEAVMTTPRSDMGDSIKKAFRNVDDILDDMHLEKNEFNQRAIRILGYNSMDISKENVQAVKEADLSLQRVLKKMTPHNTLGLLKQGINPLETNLDELEAELNKFSKEGEQEIDKYAKFLHKLEKNGEIKEEERDAYIGIYRLIRQIEKSDGAVIGSLINQGAPLSFKNLLSAVRSNKQKGMDVSVNDNFGALEELTGRENTISQQITNYYNKLAQEIGEKLEPERIATIKITAETGLEELAQMLNEANVLKQPEKEYQKEELEELKRTQKTDDIIIKTLLDYNQPVTLDNVMSAEATMNARGEMYRQLDGYSKKEKILQDEKSFLQKMEHTWEKMTSKEEANQAFEQMKQVVDDMVTLSVEVGSVKSEDIKALSLLYKQISFTTKMAQEENYEVPVIINGEITSLNLKILHNQSELSKVSITMKTEQFGKAAAEFTIEEGSVNGYIASDNANDLETLKKLENVFTQEIEDNGMQKGNVRFTESKKLDIRTFGRKEENQKSDSSNKELYKIAKSFIFALQNV